MCVAFRFLWSRHALSSILFLSLSFSSPLSFSLSLLLSVTQEFSRVSSFCPTCLPSGTQEVQHRNPDICPRLNPLSPKTAAHSIFSFSLASLYFSFPRRVGLPTLRTVSLFLSCFAKLIYRFLCNSRSMCVSSTILVSDTCEGNLKWFKAAILVYGTVHRWNYTWGLRVFVA